MTTYAEVERSIQYQLCLRHPERRLVVQMVDGRYTPWCQPCIVAGYSGPQLAPDDEQARRLGEMVREGQPAAGRAMVVAEDREVQGRQESQGRPMTIQEFDDRMALIKHVVGEMREGVHYGVIPGTSDKSLWEPGAEYLRSAFNIGWSYEMLEELEDYQKPEYRYRVRAFTLNRSGATVAEWTASAWSRERKFWCRGGRDGCPRDCDQNHSPLGMEAGMLPHNVRDRAIKRAFVALMRNVTGTTGYFKQALDVEEGGGGAGENKTTGGLLCPEHKVKTTRRTNKEGGVWYSHKTPGGTWCNLSPTVAEPPQGDAPPPRSTPAEPVAGSQAQQAAQPVPSERRLKTIDEFWVASDRQWDREVAVETLGGSLGQWLSAKMKEQGRPATWDDAYAFLVEKLGIAPEV